MTNSFKSTNATLSLNVLFRFWCGFGFVSFSITIVILLDQLIPSGRIV